MNHPRYILCVQVQWCCVMCIRTYLTHSGIIVHPVLSSMYGFIETVRFYDLIVWFLITNVNQYAYQVYINKNAMKKYVFHVSS